MTPDYSSQQLKDFEYYKDRYTCVFNRSLVALRPIKLRDHGEFDVRRCRFCQKAEPDVSFKKKAHAVPEFLGNKSILSLNECDDCNEYFAVNCEDHLSKWMLPLRALSSMEGKSGIPTYKSNDQARVIRHTAAGLHIALPKDGFPDEISMKGSGNFSIPGLETQPFRPLHAAKALVKAACSVCPVDLLDECQLAIKWVKGSECLHFKNLPIFYAFTPGNNPYRDGRVFLLRRKVDESIPFLWCLIATHNIRFQFFVPGCSSDSWVRSGGSTQLQIPQFPVPFSKNYCFGPTKFYCMDWASPELRREKPVVSYHFECIEEISSVSEARSSE